MKHRLITSAAAAAALSLALAPASHADAVCNQATPQSLGGSLTSEPGDPTPPARYTEGLKAHPGQGKGLVRAAAQSPALQGCGENGSGWYGNS